MKNIVESRAIIFCMNNERIIDKVFMGKSNEIELKLPNGRNKGDFER